MRTLSEFRCDRTGVKSSQSRLHSARFRAMGSDITLWLDHVHAPTATAALEQARARLEAAEARLSRFRPDSELSRLNASTGREARVSALLWECLETALAGAQRTDGLYDPTTLSALEAAGYDRSFRELQPDHRRPAATRSGFLGQWRSVALDSRMRTVRLPEGVHLDLGGIGKAWLAERIADALGCLGSCLVDAGGDIAVRGVPEGEPGWNIGVADPFDSDSDVTQIMIRGRGVATSGVDVRRWHQGDTVRHHIIDPRTGAPAETDVFSATVIARRADEANLHALVSLVLGGEAGLRYLETQPGVAAMLMLRDRSMLRTRSFTRFELEWEGPSR